MSKKDEHRTLKSNGEVQSEEHICAAAPIAEHPEDEFETQRRKLIKDAVKALRALTEAGVIVWRAGEGWAQACLSFRVAETKHPSGVERGLRITNDHETNELGEPRAQFFRLGSKEFEALVDEIRLDVEVDSYVR